LKGPGDMNWNLGKMDQKHWLDTCKEASNSEEVFSTFRRLPTIKYITEHGYPWERGAPLIITWGQ